MPRRDIFTVPTAMADTSEGPVQIPAFYRDASAVSAFFWCELEKVASKLNSTGLVPARFAKGRALVILGFYEYRDSTFGAYHEVLLMIATYPASCRQPWSSNLQFFRNPVSRTMGFYVIDLPLTAALPSAAGRELWGLPKFITDVSFDCAQDRFEGRVPDPDTGEMIVTLKSPFGRGLPMPPTDMVFYSNHEDSILKTIVNTRARGRITNGKKTQLTVGPARHRMVETLGDLGLNGTIPFLLQSSDWLQFRLNPGQKIESWKTPWLPYGPAA